MVSGMVANIMAAYVAWGVGDDLSMSLPFSMVATLLAACIERPFATAAGIKTQTFRRIFQANILSWFVGVAIVFAGMFSGYVSVFILMAVLAVPFSIAVEGTYLSKIAHQSGTKLRWPPIIYGNIISGVILYALVFFGLELAEGLRQSGSPITPFLEQRRIYIYATTLIVCSGLFLKFLRPTAISASGQRAEQSETQEGLGGTDSQSRLAE